MRRKLFIGLLPLLAVLAALWLGGREATLQWAAQKAVAASGGALSMAEVRGSLYGPIQIGRLQYRSPEQNIVAERAELRWSPWQLLRGRIGIERVRLATLTVESLKAVSEPPKLPATLAAPLPVDIDALQIDKIVLLAPGMRNEISNLRLMLSGDSRRWQLRNAQAQSAFGQLSAALTLDARRPFALDGMLDLTQLAANKVAPAALAPSPSPSSAGGRAERSEPLREFHVKLAGTLSALALTASFDGYGASAQGAALLTPFDALMLRSLQLNAQAVNPAQFQAGLPQAQLQIALTAQIGPNQDVSGQLLLENRMTPATLDQQGLPLRTIAAQLRGRSDALRLDDLVFDFGAAGKFAGQASLDSGLATLALHTGRLDLNALHRKLRPSAIAGDITLSNPDGVPTLRAALGQDRLHLGLHATLAAGRLQLHEASLRAGSSTARLSGEADRKSTRLNSSHIQKSRMPSSA